MSLAQSQWVRLSASNCIRVIKICHVSHFPHCALQINLEFKNKDDKIEIVHRNKIILREEKKDTFQTSFQSNLIFLDFQYCIFKTALDSKMVEKPKIKKIGKPRHDENCLHIKNSFLNALKTTKVEKLDFKTCKNYLEVKNRYKNVIQKKSEEHWCQYINKLNLASNSSSFWGTVRSLNRCTMQRY